ncbi:MAG TPA: thioredoxin domain-containing protein [Terriglobia bacterium]|nr:thioredoxin domain-containing protein [Terriglobia bacterium]
MRKHLLLALSLTGLFDSIYLLWEYTSPAHPMVCMGGGCDAVRASVYSHVGGLPVPVFGIFMYAFLAFLIFLYPLLPVSVGRLSENVVALVSGAAFFVSIYLTGLEAFVLHSWCVWCVLSALLVTAIFILALVDRSRPGAPLEPAQALSAVQKNFALILFGFVIGVPAFILLTRNGSLPVTKPPSAQTVEAHLVRPETHFYGDPHARVTVVEFGDFKCPACRQAEATSKKIREHFGDKIRFAFRQFPLVGLHAESEKAAEASECVGQQGKFWQGVDMLYEHQDDLSLPAINRYAGEMGLDSRKFVGCLQKGEMASRVAQDIEDGQALGVHATPTFFVDGHRIVGPIPYPQFEELVENELTMEGSGQAAAGINPKSPEPVKKAPAAKAATQKKVAAAPPSTSSSNDTMQVLGGSSNLLASLQSSSAEACSEAEAKKRQPVLIGTDQAKQYYGEQPQPLFVDVRSASAFQSGHIPGALNMPIASFEQDWNRLPKNKMIVLYEDGRSSGDICAFSRSAGRILLSEGFGYNDVRVYRDGLAGWTKAGLPVKR